MGRKKSGNRRPPSQPKAKPVPVSHRISSGWAMVIAFITLIATAVGLIVAFDYFTPRFIIADIHSNNPRFASESKIEFRNEGNYPITNILFSYDNLSMKRYGSTIKGMQFKVPASTLPLISPHSSLKIPAIAEEFALTDGVFVGQCEYEITAEYDTVFFGRQKSKWKVKLRVPSNADIQWSWEEMEP